MQTMGALEDDPEDAAANGVDEVFGGVRCCPPRGPLLYDENDAFGGVRCCPPLRPLELLLKDVDGRLPLLRYPPRKFPRRPLIALTSV